MDKIPITRHQLVAFFLPGFIFILFAFIACQQINSLTVFMDYTNDVSLFIAVVALILSFAIGILFDGIRDGFLESIWDNFKPINWKYFNNPNKDEIEGLYLRFYTYYTFDLNLSISNIFLIIIFLSFNYTNKFVWIVLIISTIISIVDACSLRKIIREITNKNN